MSEPIIKVDNLGKKYIIGHNVESGAIEGGFPTLRDRIINSSNWLKNKTISTLTGKKMVSRSYEEFWALKDISFEINQGDIIGIVGRNGAGKSTLLKILSRITEPTTGQFTLNGRVASLLEVGTGFHPELTGRENIYLNGAILGMSKAEIKRKFDAIVDFAEVEKFLDTPVKRYSSGMYVRLAFAVAAHLEPEILIVDEVLAVGDAAFQKKCLGKMQDVSLSEGRTVIFVSHNMDAIERLCSQSILLQGGRIAKFGATHEVVTQYLSNNLFKNTTLPNQLFDLSNEPRTGSGIARFQAAQYSSLNPAISFLPYCNGPLELLLTIQSDKSLEITSLTVAICNQSGTVLIDADFFLYGKVMKFHQGSNIIKVNIEQLHLNPGSYAVSLYLAQQNNIKVDHVEYAFEIKVIDLRPEKFVHDSIGTVSSKFEFTQVI